MPLGDPTLLGSEKDGSPSHEYCKYCYQDGEFVNPEMSLNEMTSLVIDQMKKREIDQKIIEMSVSVLPNLKRWKAKTTAM
jgi:hypothetical protein